MNRYVTRRGRRIEVETLPGPPTKSKRRPKDEPFVKMPLNWAATAAKATKSPAMVICTLLLHAAWKADGKAFTLSNGALAKAGVNRETKRRVLLNLEAAGLIAVERNHGRSPRVTLKTVTPT